MTYVVRICELVGGLPLGILLATNLLSVFSWEELATQLAESLELLESDTRDLRPDQRTLYAVFERSWQLLSSQEQHLLMKLAIFPGTFDRPAVQVIMNAPL
ncbi:MAG: hypothetical protein K0U66_08905, partial [Gammaproteobacteria bacterium]|nr:hypothetical protein [Gammaproteobacteria bacterium]